LGSRHDTCNSDSILFFIFSPTYAMSNTESMDNRSRDVQGVIKAFLDNRVSQCDRTERTRRWWTRQIRSIEKLNIEIYTRQNITRVSKLWFITQLHVTQYLWGATSVVVYISLGLDVDKLLIEIAPPTYPIFYRGSRMLRKNFPSIYGKKKKRKYFLPKNTKVYFWFLFN